MLKRTRGRKPSRVRNIVPKSGALYSSCAGGRPDGPSSQHDMHQNHSTYAQEALYQGCVAQKKPVARGASSDTAEVQVPQQFASTPCPCNRCLKRRTGQTRCPRGTPGCFRRPPRQHKAKARDTEPVQKANFVPSHSCKLSRRLADRLWLRLISEPEGMSATLKHPD